MRPSLSFFALVFPSESSVRLNLGRRGGSLFAVETAQLLGELPSLLVEWSYVPHHLSHIAFSVSSQGQKDREVHVCADMYVPSQTHVKVVPPAFNAWLLQHESLDMVFTFADVLLYFPSTSRFKSGWFSLLESTV